MSHQLIIDLSRDAILTALLVAAPLLLIALGVGLVISIIQSVTQIQEQTLTFVPKLIVIFGLLAIMGPWLGGAMAQFARMCFEGFPMVVGR